MPQNLQVADKSVLIGRGFIAAAHFLEQACVLFLMWQFGLENLAPQFWHVRVVWPLVSTKRGFFMAGRKWIQSAIKPQNKGALHRDLGVPHGQKIPSSKLKAAAAKGGKVGARARLAVTLKGMK